MKTLVNAIFDDLFQVRTGLCTSGASITKPQYEAYTTRCITIIRNSSQSQEVMNPDPNITFHVVRRVSLDKDQVQIVHEIGRFWFTACMVAQDESSCGVR